MRIKRSVLLSILVASPMAFGANNLRGNNANNNEVRTLEEARTDEVGPVAINPDLQADKSWGYGGGWNQQQQQQQQMGGGWGAGWNQQQQQQQQTGGGWGGGMQQQQQQQQGGHWRHLEEVLADEPIVAAVKTESVAEDINHDKQQAQQQQQAMQTPWGQMQQQQQQQQGGGGGE